MQQPNTPHSLPVCTLANDQRVLRDRLYADRVADRLLEFLFDLDSYRSTIVYRISVLMGVLLTEVPFGTHLGLF
jgi:hypothetical protein